MEIETPSVQSFDLQSNHSFSFSTTACSQACSDSEMARHTNPSNDSTATMVVDSTQSKSSGAMFIASSLPKPNSEHAQETNRSSSLNPDPSQVTSKGDGDGEVKFATSESDVKSPGAKSVAVNDQENGNSFKSSSAAVSLQKVYRSYRTRRRLADTAVVAEELWWQAINFARLNHSTISFFDFLKPETAASRWNRVTLNASKVGKGLFEDSKAQKLAFEHWIEAIDPRHRYGHNLHKYYEEWCDSQSGQPFFYWLDVGEGKEVDLKGCPRTKLRQECIKYLGPKERENYEYIIIDGKIIHKQTEKPLATTDGSEKAKWIFVMSTSKKLYAEKKGSFHHSSFLAGGVTLAAGRLVAENGVLKTISAYSGHYRPSEENLGCFITFLTDNGVNLDQVEIRSATEDYENYDRSKSSHEGSTVGITSLPEPEPEPEPEHVPVPEPSLLENPSAVEKDQTLKPDEVAQTEPTEIAEIEGRGSYKRTLSGGLQSPTPNVPKTAILQRINSKKARSYQLGNQVSLKWSTGAGPRIGCIADYPMELRVQALEIVDLSPRLPPTPSGYRQSDHSPRFPYTPSGYRQSDHSPRFPYTPSGYRQSDLSPKFPTTPSGYRQPPRLISPASRPTSGFCCNDKNSLA